MRPVVFCLSCVTGLLVAASSVIGCGDWGAPLAGRTPPEAMGAATGATVGAVDALAPSVPPLGAEVSDAGADTSVATAGLQGADPGRAPAPATPAPAKQLPGSDAGVSAPRADAGASPECVSDTDCPERVCESGTCRSPGCDDGRRNGTETDVDCGGSCTPCGAGGVCRADSDCSASACQDGRCCGGELADCTRCARRLAGTNKCALSGDAGPDCDAFLQCLADNPEVCPRRLASGCSNESGAVCSVQNFGGNGSAGIKRADSILGTAGCKF